MRRFLFVLFISAAVSCFSGCKSVSEKPGLYSKKPVVTLEIQISGKGTKSEGSSGYLVINGVRIPDCFFTVVADGKVYTFKTKSMLWGEDGYFPDHNILSGSVYPSADKKISDTDLAAGWSEVSERCQNVPDGWIFVIWENGRAAVSPDKIDQLVKAKSIRQIQRNTMFSGKIIK